MKKFINISALCFLCSTLLYSQGAYLQRGESGFGISAGLGSNKDANSIGAGVGYSINGVADLQLSLTRVSLDEKLEGYDVSATAFVPSVTFYAIKEIVPFLVGNL